MATWESKNGGNMDASATLSLNQTRTLTKNFIPEQIPEPFN